MTILLLYLFTKYAQRRFFLRSLRMRRMAPGEVQAKLQSDDKVHIIDLRHRQDFKVLPHTIPGSVRIPMERIDDYFDDIPRDADIILNCS